MPHDPLACVSHVPQQPAQARPPCALSASGPPDRPVPDPSPARPACPNICLHPQGAGPLPLPEDVSFLDLSFLREEAPSGRAAGGNGEMDTCGPEVN